MRCTVVAVGSCLVVAGNHRTMEILDTHHNHVWNLPPLENYHTGCSLVTVANQVAVIGGFHNPTCASFPLMDKNTWCFRLPFSLVVLPLPHLLPTLHKPEKLLYFDFYFSVEKLE